MKAKTATDQPSRWLTERRWAVRQGGAQYECTLLYQGTSEVQVQVSSNGVGLPTHLCESRASAIAKADELRGQYLRDGGLLLA